MSWKDEEIDGLFKQAKTPEAPAFQESFWTEMEAMLPQQKPRRKAGFWWFSAATVAILAISVGGYAWLNGTTAPEAGKTVTANSDRAAASQTTNTPASNDEAIASGTSTESETAANTPSEVSASTTGGSRNHQHLQRNPAPHTNGTQGATGEAIQPAETPTTIPSVEQDSEIATITEEQPTTVDGLPTTRLVLHPELAQGYRMPERLEHYYIQASGGIGQSALTGVAGRSDLIQSYSLGAGIYGPRAGRLYFTLGLQGRVDFVQNIVGTASNPDATKTETRYRQLYAVETPLSAGVHAGRNRFALTVTPGFQLGFTGTYTHYQADNTVLRENERTSGKIANGKTMTMEIGLAYMRQICPKWYVGAACNADILRPFGDQTFQGTQRTLPLNGSILLRKTF